MTDVPDRETLAGTRCSGAPTWGFGATPGRMAATERKMHMAEEAYGIC
jgi:hypothetical protein